MSIDLTHDKPTTLTVPRATIEVPSKLNIDLSKEGSLDVVGRKKKYAIVGDALFAKVSADEAPSWLLSIIDEVVATSVGNELLDIDALKTSVLTAISEVEVAKNRYQELINIEATIEGIINSRITTLNANLAQTNADIVTLGTTRVTPTEAVAIATNTLNASLGPTGSIGSELNTINATVASLNSSYAISINALESSYSSAVTNITFLSNAQSSLQSYVGIDNAGASTNTGISAYMEDSSGVLGGADSQVANSVYTEAGVAKSKWEYSSNVQINNQHYTSGFGLNLSTAQGDGSELNPYVSEFWVDASRFKFTNSNNTGIVSPFTIDATGAMPQVTFNGVVSFSNVTGTADLVSRPALATPGTTVIDAGNVSTGQLSADRIFGGVLVLDTLNTFTPPALFSGTIADKNGISVYDNGVRKVRLGKLI